MIFKIILIGLIVIIPVLLFKFKIKINFKSFLSKGFRPKRSGFGVYCFTASQGGGKTTSLAAYLYDNRDKLYVFSNIHTLKIKGMPIRYFTGFSELNEYKTMLDTNKDNIWSEITHHKQIQLV